MNRSLDSNTTHEVTYMYLLYGVTVKSTSGACDPVFSVRSTSYTPRSFTVVGSRTKISKKFGNSCIVTVNGCPGVVVKGSLFLLQSSCRYLPDALVSMTSFSGGSRTMTRGETLSSTASPVYIAKPLMTSKYSLYSCEHQHYMIGSLDLDYIQNSMYIG